MSNSPNDVVIRLVQPIEGTKRNITIDNWFTSLPLALQLLEEKKLTVVGTLRRNETCIPKQFIDTKNWPINSSLFGFDKDCTLTSYTPKKNKVVLAISTLHNDVDTTTGEKKKSDIITFYNQTKCGVDRLDQMCSLYDVARNSRHWPLTIFFNLINICGINAMNVYSANKNYAKVNRADFLETLALCLIRPNTERRIINKSLPKSLRLRGRKLLGIEKETQTAKTLKTKRPGGVEKCYLCGRARNKSTRNSCETCYKWVCSDHLKYICDCCYNKKENDSSSDDMDNILNIELLIIIKNINLTSIISLLIVMCNLGSYLIN